MKWQLQSADSFEQLAMSIPKEIISTFRQALVLGHWPDGRAVTPDQRLICQEAIELHPSLANQVNLLN